MAGIAISDGLRAMADQLDREAPQHGAETDEDASLCQGQGN